MAGFCPWYLGQSDLRALWGGRWRDTRGQVPEVFWAHVFPWVVTGDNLSPVPLTLYPATSGRCGTQPSPVPCSGTGTPQQMQEPIQV